MASYVVGGGDPNPQTVGGFVLTTLNGLMYFTIINDGPQQTIASLQTLSDFISGGGAGGVNLTATGNSLATAFPLVGGTSLFTSVPAGTGCGIPTLAAIGSGWEAWNEGVNNLLVYPIRGAQINAFGTNVPATIVPGGRSKFIVSSRTQIYAG